MDELVADASAMIEALGARTAVLVGHSQGGAVFTRVALARPDLVEALVIVDAMPSGPPPAGRAQTEQLSRLIGDLGARDRLLASVKTSMFSEAAQRDQPEMIDRELHIVVQQDPSRLAQAALLPLSYASVEERLGELEMRVLVMWGGADAAAPPATAEIYRKKVPHAEVRIIPEAGHCLPLEQPDAVSDALAEFLA